MGGKCLGRISMAGASWKEREQLTLGDLLSAVDLCDLLLEELVTLLADVYDLLASNAELGDGLEDLVGDNTGILVLGQGVWVVEGIICGASRSAACL